MAKPLKFVKLIEKELRAAFVEIRTHTSTSLPPESEALPLDHKGTLGRPTRLVLFAHRAATRLIRQPGLISRISYDFAR